MQYLTISKYIEYCLDGKLKGEEIVLASNVLPNVCARSVKCVRSWAKTSILTGKLIDSRQ